MTYEEARAKIVEALTKKLKTKTKFYFNDLCKILNLKPRQAKPLINQMVTDGTLEYWTSGSTSMYGLKGAGKQRNTDGES